MKRMSLLISSLTVVAGSYFAPLPAVAADGVTVGLAVAQSGFMTAYDGDATKSVKLWVEQQNAAGGLLGRQLKLFNYDTQSSMQLYSQYAQKLALSDKVDVIHGGITSASREAIRPVFDRAKILYFYNTLYEGGVCDRDIFCTGTTPAQTVDHVVTYGLKTWGKKTYIIAADYNYGQITSKWMTKFTRDGGGTVLATDFFPLDVTNFASAITRIQQAQPDFVLSALVGANHSSFYRQWDSAGMKSKIPLASTVFGLGDELATMDTSTTDGIVTSFGYYQDLGTPASDAFVKGLKAKFGADVTDVGELDSATYEGIMLWAEGVKKAGSIETPKVIAALESGISIEGPSGTVKIDPATHHTIRNAYLARPKDRKWEIMDKYPDQFPSDTGGVCDLLKAPTTNKQFVPDIKA